jgi:YbbR domain-containing protein
MKMRFPRWLTRYFSTFLLALILAVIVWVAAVTSADPNQEQIYLVPVDIIGLASNMEITSELPDRLSISLFAPRSILDEITKESGTLRAWLDLSGLETGTHELSLQYQIDERFRPVHIVDISPTTTDITLEALISKTVPIQTEVRGEPTLGYQASPPEWSHEEVTISGRASQVEKVATVKTTLNITGAEETIERTLNLSALDEAGSVVTDVLLTPSQIGVVQTITLRGGYRNMVVKVVTAGQVAEGYRQTSISISPPNVMVFSANPAVVDQMPGYIETAPLDLTGSFDDIETILGLNLPEGVSVIGDPNVLVQVGVAAMEGNLKIIRMVEVIGVLPELEARAAPDSVDVILFGSLPVLDALTETDVRVVIDLTGLEVGTYQLPPEVVILPERVQAEAVSPENIEVEIIDPTKVTPSPTP